MQLDFFSLHIYIFFNGKQDKYSPVFIVVSYLVLVLLFSVMCYSETSCLSPWKGWGFSLYHINFCLWFSSADSPLCTWHRKSCCGDPAWVYYLLANGKFLNEYVSAPRIQPVSWTEERSICLSNWMFCFIPLTNGGLTQQFERGTTDDITVTWVCVYPT